MPTPSDSPSTDTDEPPQRSPDDDADPPTVTLDRAALESGSSGGLARLLAEEFRHGRVHADERAALRDAIAAGDQRLGDQLSDLQMSISDLQAYIGALDPILSDGEFPNENLESLTDRRIAMEDTLDTVEADLEEAADSCADLEEAVESLHMNVSEVADRRDQLESMLTDLEETIVDLEEAAEEIRTLDGRADTIETDLETFSDRCESLRSFFDNLESALETIGD